MERSALQGLAAFRWGAWLWMATVLLASRQQLERPWLAVGLAGAALAVTVVDTALLRSYPAALLRPAPVAAELAVGLGLVFGDGVAYGPGHAFSTSQSLGSVWPLAGILVAGVAYGPALAAAAGGVVGTARLGAVVANGASIDTGGRALSVLNTVVFYALGGAVAGYLARLLRRAETEISAARARDEVARTLHDGVLQTLAVVERRSRDPALAKLARDQERELRDWLFGAAAPTGPVGDVGRALRACAARFEESFPGRAQVLVADDLPALAPGAVGALAGAVGEALMNAGRHGGASRVQVYVEPDGSGVVCTVKDDGAGFDVASTPEGVGLARSIRARVGEAGGRVEVVSAPGRGTEVLVWLPS